MDELPNYVIKKEKLNGKDEEQVDLIVRRKLLGSNAIRKEIGSYRAIVIVEDEEETPTREEVKEGDSDCWFNLLSLPEPEELGRVVKRNISKVLENNDGDYYKDKGYVILSGS